MVTNNKLLNCPPLRFPEFEGEWERTKLGEILKVQGGYAFKSNNYSTSGIPIIRISNLPICARYVDLIDCVYYPTNFCIDNQFKIQKGELLIAMSGATTGKTAIYNNESCAYLNQRVGLFRVKSKGTFYPFLYVYVETEQFKSSLEKLLITGAQPNISSCDIEGLQAILPSLPEQEKIASFLSLLDERIEAQRQTIKERKNQKKVLLSQIFSQSLRFPGFSDEWQQITLGRIAEIMKGAGISKNQLSPQGHPCILYGELYTRYLSEVIREIKSHTEIDPSSLILSRAGDVIIPSSGETAIDIAVARCVSVDNVALGGDLNIIRSSTTDGRFLAYQLNGAKKKEIAEFAQGVAVIHLYGRDLSKLRISLPSLEEQKKIAELFTIFDERIEAEEALLACYERQKRYLLRQMFV